MRNAPKNPVLDAVRTNLMVELDERREALRRGGKTLYDFGVGDPREPTPEFVREALRKGVPDSSQYPSAFGTPALRRACVGWVERRFGVSLDADRQVVPAAGAKESIFHVPLTFAGGAERRVVVIPDPGYATYETGTRFAGLEALKIPLSASRNFLLEPDEVGEATLSRTLLFWLSYPHNPTGAVAPREYLARVGAAAIRHGFIVCSDECYVDIYFDQPPLSMLQVQVENVLAFHSCSKRSGMTGYRSGFVAGDADLVARVKQMRPYPGLASPDFVSAAATAAWSEDSHAAERGAIFRRKRDRFLSFCSRRGLVCDGSAATLYLWVRVPAGDTSQSYTMRLLEEGIIVAPGTAFGAGEGYIRVALVPTEADCEEAIERWSSVRS